MSSLNNFEQLICEFIAEYIRDHQRPPTYEEIGKAVGIGSSGQVEHYIKLLHKKGLVSRELGARRSVTPSIPIHGDIAAGEPLATPPRQRAGLSIGEHLGYGNIYALIVKGDSMIEDHIYNGDYVIIRPQPDCNNGDVIVAVHLEHGTSSATLKRFFKKSNWVYLQPAHKGMKTIYIPADKWDREWQVQGIVVLIYRKTDGRTINSDGS